MMTGRIFEWIPACAGMTLVIEGIGKAGEKRAKRAIGVYKEQGLDEDAARCSEGIRGRRI
jgi:hypothetical protein